jgi:hypothetical protein
MAVYTTLAEAKTHLRVDFTDDDVYIAAIQNLVEELVLSEVKGSIAGEGTVTTAGVVALVGDGTNFLDFIVGTTITVEGETVRTIATITDDEHLTVSLAFTTTDSALTYTMHEGLPLVGGVLPLGLKQAMLLMIGHFYSIREPATVGVGVTKIPYGYEYLVAPFKNWTIA